MKRRLNKTSYQGAVNVDSYSKINLSSRLNILPIGEINKVINVGEQFDDERQSSPYYRLTGSIKPLFTNILFNNDSNNGWKVFNNPFLRDKDFPLNGVNADDPNDLTYAESIDMHLDEVNSWYGYLEPLSTRGTICSWVDMEPNRTLFNLSPVNYTKNWELTVTYPSGNVSNDGSDIINNGVNGILLLSTNSILVGGRESIMFSTPIKHGLSQGETVRIKGAFINNAVISNMDFEVIKIGQENGDNEEYYFTIQTDLDLTVKNTSRMSRLYSGNESEYYFRRFTKINVKGVSPTQMERDDYEIYPLAFAQTAFEDKVNEFVINEDIDITGLKDNRNRPLSEIFVTLTKTTTGGFTEIKSGLNIPFNEHISNHLSLSDVRRITNSDDTHKPLEEDVNMGQDWFYGDISEFNSVELKESTLSDVYHRFNTVNRETEDSVTNPNFTEGETLTLGVREEGYMYKAHHKIQIREYSSYIEQGTSETLNKPTYATNLNDGRYIWRDLLNIGSNDMNETTLDYPFLNGAHYLNANISLPLKRQDPFNLYRLQYTDYPPDVPGKEMDDKTIIKSSTDVC